MHSRAVRGANDQANSVSDQAHPGEGTAKRQRVTPVAFDIRVGDGSRHPWRMDKARP